MKIIITEQQKERIIINSGCAFLDVLFAGVEVKEIFVGWLHSDVVYQIIDKDGEPGLLFNPGDGNLFYNPKVKEFIMRYLSVDSNTFYNILRAWVESKTDFEVVTIDNTKRP